jgi:hypothetical protein
LTLKIDGKVYKITNKVNGKCYIGITKNSVVQRFQQHCRNRESTPISLAIKKYGKDNFTVEQIDSHNNPKELFELEAKHIIEHNSLKPKGYNILSFHNAKECYANSYGKSYDSRLFSYLNNKREYSNIYLKFVKGVYSYCVRFKINSKTYSKIFKSLVDAVNYRNAKLYELTNNPLFIVPINYVDWIFEFYSHYIKRLIIIKKWKEQEQSTL